MSDKTIYLNDSDLLQLVYCACTENTLSVNYDYKLIAKLKKVFEDRCMESDWEDVEYYLGIRKSEEEIEEEKEIEERKKEISNSEGIFYCPTCNITTNEKTYTTKCVICDTPLRRGGK